MVWIFYLERHPTERVKNVKHAGGWWTTDIEQFEVQMTAEAVQKLQPTFQQAYDKKKPLTFLVVSNVKSRWRKITSVHGRDLYISIYGDDIFTCYDPDKIEKLKTNSVSAYFKWEPIPETLKRFIEGAKV